MAISHDSKYISSCSNDKMVKVWDIQYGENISTLYGHTDWVNCSCFHPDGKTLASTGWDKVVRVI